MNFSTHTTNYLHNEKPIKKGISIVEAVITLFFISLAIIVFNVDRDKYNQKVVYKEKIRIDTIRNAIGYYRALYPQQEKFTQQELISDNLFSKSFINKYKPVLIHDLTYNGFINIEGSSIHNTVHYEQVKKLHCELLVSSVFSETEQLIVYGQVIKSKKEDIFNMDNTIKACNSKERGKITMVFPK